MEIDTRIAERYPALVSHGGDIFVNECNRCKAIVSDFEEKACPFCGAPASQFNHVTVNFNMKVTRGYQNHVVTLKEPPMTQELVEDIIDRRMEEHLRYYEHKRSDYDY